MLYSPQNVVLQIVVLVVMCILFSVSNSMSPHLSRVIVTLIDTLHYNSGSKGCLPGQQATAAQSHCTKATQKRPYPPHATQKGANTKSQNASMQQRNGWRHGRSKILTTRLYANEQQHTSMCSENMVDKANQDMVRNCASDGSTHARQYTGMCGCSA